MCSAEASLERVPREDTLARVGTSPQTLKVRLLDPSGAARVRLLFPALALLFEILVTLFSPLAWPWGAAAAVSIALWLLPLRFRTRAVSLRISPGNIRVVNANVLNCEMRPKDVIGCTTTTLGDTACLLLSLRHRREPTLLMFDSEAEMDAAREALAIGHVGFGQINVPGSASIFSIIGTAIALVMLAIGVPTLICCVVGIPALLLIRRRFYEAAIVLGIDGIRYEASGTHCFLPYSSIEAIALSEDKKSIEISLVEGAPLRVGGRELISNDAVRKRSISMRGTSPALRAPLVSAILDASSRARGNVRPKAPVNFPLATLAMGADTVAKWLARIDSIAASANSGGYRSGHVDTDELWRIYEDPDFSPDVRAAAARILQRVAKDSEERLHEGSRIFHEEKDAKRIRIVLQEALSENDEIEIAALGRYSIPPR